MQNLYENLSNQILDIDKKKFLELVKKIQKFFVSINKKMKDIEFLNCDDCRYYIITLNKIKILKGVYKFTAGKASFIRHYDCHNIEEKYLKILNLFDAISSKKLSDQYIQYFYIPENGVRFEKDLILLNCLKLALKIDDETFFNSEIYHIYYELGHAMSYCGLNMDIKTLYRAIERSNLKKLKVESIRDFVRYFVSELAL